MSVRLFLRLIKPMTWVVKSDSDTRESESGVNASLGSNRFPLLTLPIHWDLGFKRAKTLISFFLYNLKREHISECKFCWYFYIVVIIIKKTHFINCVTFKEYKPFFNTFKNKMIEWRLIPKSYLSQLEDSMQSVVIFTHESSLHGDALNWIF